VKTLICALFRSCYLSIVQTDSPAPPGFRIENSKVCVMTLSRFERGFDRIAPVFLLALGLFAALSTAGLGA